MARHYVLGSWANADEFDYSGEQLMGSRHGKSICMDHMLPNGMANLKRYGDPIESKPTTKPRKSVIDSIDLAQCNFDRLERMSIQLDDEYSSGSIDAERYELLRYKMDERLIKAWERLEKENLPIWEKEDRRYEQEKGLIFNIDDVVLDKRSNVDYSLISEDSLFSKLSDGNFFKDFYCGCLTTYQAMIKMYHIAKQIIQEGLI